MPVPIDSTLGILGDNLRKRRSALPLGRRKVTAWTRGLHLPRGGATVLYTGQMWQMVPAINAMSARLAKMEGSWMAGYFGVARRINRLVNLAGVMARGDPKEVREYAESLRDIARVLRAAGVEFGYLYEDDLYAGALAHDEGLDDALRVHARRVASILRSRGVREAITVDPHTTNMLRSVYPTLVPGFDVRVRTYLEVLAERRPIPRCALDVDVTVHDSCLYARREGVAEQPRELLRRGGVRIHEVERSGKLTQCCGGPIEMLFPARSNALATQRVAQLSACSSKVVTLCPLCLSNLRRVAPPGLEISDVSGYLAGAYCAPSPGAAPLSEKAADSIATPAEVPA